MAKEVKAKEFAIAYYERSNGGGRNYSIIILGEDGLLYKSDTCRKKLTPYNMQVDTAPKSQRSGDETDPF